MSSAVEPGADVVDPFGDMAHTVVGLVRDPYPDLAEKRRQATVHLESDELTGAVRAVAYGHDAVVEILRDNERFSSAVYAELMGMLMGHTILEMDEPEHRRHRALVSPAFRSKVLAHWEEQHVGATVDRTLIPQAIEEGLRWEPPLTGIVRLCTRDTEVDGVAIPAGAVVGVNIGAANRDDTRYRDPDRFDIFRDPQQHVAFGFGPHMCLGMHLARMETRVVLDAVLDRLPSLRLDPAADDVHVHGDIFRSPTALPVLFDPR